MLFCGYLPALLFFGMMLAFSPAQAESSQQLFGYEESRFSGLNPFPKWRTALERFYAEKAGGIESCHSDLGEECGTNAWSAFLGRLKKVSAINQLEAVNRFANAREYIVDPINWGVDDYWESPLQFLTKNGDCEDYAIIKYLSLRALGWPAEKMRIVVLHDANLNVAHANLVVDLDHRRLVLDNQFPQVIEQSRIHHYKPIYGVNEENWWRFSRKSG